MSMTKDELKHHIYRWRRSDDICIDTGGIYFDESKEKNIQAEEEIISILDQHFDPPTSDEVKEAVEYIEAFMKGYLPDLRHALQRLGTIRKALNLG